MKNLSVATTEIQELVDKRNKILEKTANILSEVIIGRAASGRGSKTANIEDIEKSIKDFSLEDQKQILLNMVVTIATSSAGSSRGGNGYRGNDLASMINNGRR